MADYIQLRRSGYYIRYVIPCALRSIAGRREVNHPLNTHHRRHAKRLASAIVFALSKKLFKAEKEMKTLTDFDIKALVDQYTNTIKREALRYHLANPMARDENDNQIDTLDILIYDYSDYLASSNLKAVIEDTKKLLEESGYAVDANSHEFKLLARSLLNADRECFKYQQQLLRGEMPDISSHANTPIEKAAPISNAPTITEAAADYITWLEGDNAGRGHGAITRYTDAANDLAFIIGNRKVDQVKRDDAITFRDTMRQLPVHRNKRKDLRGKNCNELVELANHGKQKLYASKTIDEKLGALDAIFKWLHNKEVTTRNPFKDIPFKSETERPTQPYTTEDLKRLFSVELYDPTSSYARKKTTKGSHWWLPALALYTGARAGELMQLQTTDFKVEDEILFADLTDEEETERLKTKAAKRRVPIHPALIELGLEEYIKELEKHGKERLLFGLNISENSEMKPSDRASKWYGTYKKLVDESWSAQNKVLHSFRHTFVTAARQANKGIADVRLQEIVGHEKSMGITGKYDHGSKMEHLYEVVRGVQYGDLDLRAITNDWRPILQRELTNQRSSKK